MRYGARLNIFKMITGKSSSIQRRYGARLNMIKYCARLNFFEINIEQSSSNHGSATAWTDHAQGHCEGCEVTFGLFQISSRVPDEVFLIPFFYA